ncbi:MAG: methyltransferase domain-containing protein [Bacillota bacterium]
MSIANTGIEMQERIKSVKERIEKLIEAGHLDEAKAALRKYDSKMPGDPDICSMLAVIHIIEGLLDKAEAIIFDGMKKDSVQFDLLFNLAYIRERKGLYEEALELYATAGTVASGVAQKQSVDEAVKRLQNVDHSLEIKDKARIVFFVKEGLDSFLGDIIEGLSDEYRVRKIIVSDFKQIDAGMEWADVCWFEWCDELVVYGSGLPLAKEKKIICRLHSYEAFTNYIHKVAWRNVDKVIFVAEHIRDFVMEKHPGLKPEQTIVIPNGIELRKYLFKNREPGYNVAYVGFINYKKGPMLLLHTFKALYDRDRRYKLYIAGKFQDYRYELYFKQMINELGLEKNIFLDGWQENIDKWLEDKNYILCTSLLEGNPVALMEAMSKGIKPIIHNFVGAKEIYPGKYVWNTISEAADMIMDRTYDSNEYHSFIANNFSLEKQVRDIVNAIHAISVQESKKELNIAVTDSDECNSISISHTDDPVTSYYNNFLEYLKNDRKRPNPRHEYLKKSLGSIIKPGDKVLDLGCGIGITTEYINSLGVSKVIGVDLSPKLIEYAKSTVIGVEFIVHDITCLELDDKFDVIVLCDVMEHVPSDRYDDLFRVIKKHLKEQGLVYLSIPDPGYQEFVKTYRPELLQIIDNCISYEMVRKLCEDNMMLIRFFNIYGISLENQYNEYILCNKSNFGEAWESLKLKV